MDRSKTVVANTCGHGLVSKDCRCDQEVPREDSFSSMNNFNYYQDYTSDYASYSSATSGYQAWQEYGNPNGQLFVYGTVRTTPNGLQYIDGCMKQVAVDPPFFCENQRFMGNPITTFGPNDGIAEGEPNSSHVDANFAPVRKNTFYNEFTGETTQEYHPMEQLPLSCPARVEFEPMNPPQHNPDQYTNGTWNLSHGAGYTQNSNPEFGYNGPTNVYPEARSAPPVGSCIVTPPRRYKTKQGSSSRYSSNSDEDKRINEKKNGEERYSSERRHSDSDSKRKKNRQSVRTHRKNIAQYIENGPKTINFLESGNLEMEEALKSAQQIIQMMESMRYSS